MPGRQYTASNYRYGFNNGSEKDDEISGIGNHITTFFREGDLRLGLWWGIDPVTQAWQSSYAFMNNNPIFFMDIWGDVGDNPTKEVNKKYREAKRKIIADQKRFHPAFIDKHNRLIPQETLDKAKRRQDKFDSDPQKYSQISDEYNRLLDDLSHKLDRVGPSSSGKWGDIVRNSQAPYTATDKVRMNYNVNSLTVNPLGSNNVWTAENLTISQNDNQVLNANGPLRFAAQTFKVKTADEIKLSLSRIQPAYGLRHPADPADFALQPNGSFIGMTSVPPFTYTIRVTYKR